MSTTPRIRRFALVPAGRPEESAPRRFRLVPVAGERGAPPARERSEK